MKHCKECPTAQGFKNGHDPEAYEAFMSERHMNGVEYGIPFKCAWENHVCYGVKRAIEIAKLCHRRGVKPPFKLHPMYQEQR